jgi:CheY-like chemotaxis protein
MADSCLLPSFCGISRQFGTFCLWCFSPCEDLNRRALPPILWNNADVAVVQSARSLPLILIQTEKKAGTGLTRMATVTKKQASVVLIVEDDREMLSLLCDEFWGAEYQLRQARNGDEAFLSVLEFVPDLILTDLRMPAGGADYISRLRTVAQTCPIIVMTAFGDARCKSDVLKAGANAYFDKPVRIAELKQCVQQLLNHKSP